MFDVQLMRSQLACWIGIILVAGAVLATPTVAQERSVGMTIGPMLQLHDEAVCCMSVGVWRGLGRFEIGSLTDGAPCECGHFTERRFDPAPAAR